MKKTIIALFLALACLYAAKAPTQMAVTSAEVAFRYTRPDTTACTWEVSDSATYSPLLPWLVNNQTDNGASGERWFVVITLSDSTAYYWRQTCGSEVYTGTFTTRALETGTGSGVFLGLGGTREANAVTVQYGFGAPTLPGLLGNQIDAECTPHCRITLPVSPGSLVFYRYVYRNGSDALGDFGPINVVGW